MTVTIKSYCMGRHLYLSQECACFYNKPVITRHKIIRVFQLFHLHTKPIAKDEQQKPQQGICTLPT